MHTQQEILEHAYKLREEIWKTKKREFEDTLREHLIKQDH